MILQARLCLLLGLLISSSVRAQTDSLKNTVRRSFPDYYQEIQYFGKRDQYFTVRTFLKNGTLFRLDSYTLLPKTLPNGFQLDSLSRIIHYGPTKIMYRSGKLYISCEYKDDILSGPFMVFYEDGAIKRKEYYRSGNLAKAKSKCYSQDGNLEQCEPFYQAAKFLGKSSDLTTYLKQKLESVIDGVEVRQVNAIMTINEIGQIIRVNVVVNRDMSASQRFPAVVTYMQQAIRNMPEWTPDKLNWKPAINDGKPTPSTCILSVYRTYGSLQYNLTYRM
jgi:hypothetical protein